MSIAVLFCDPVGIYSTFPNLDLWPADRDARQYDGAISVVAHPPCQLWGRFAHVNFARWGGDHNRPGNDGDCFASALASVRKHGGVLEHPAFSDAWKAFSLPRPVHAGWNQVQSNEWVCEVWQSAYGHQARKRTWLFYCGDVQPEDMLWSRPPGTHQIGFHDQRGKDKNKPTISGKKASATPLAFAVDLIRLAKSAKRS